MSGRESSAAALLDRRLNERDQLRTSSSAAQTPQVAEDQWLEGTSYRLSHKSLISLILMAWLAALDDFRNCSGGPPGPRKAMKLVGDDFRPWLIREAA
jgi:hypothetical protein